MFESPKQVLFSSLNVDAFAIRSTLSCCLRLSERYLENEGEESYGNVKKGGEARLNPPLATTSVEHVTAMLRLKKYGVFPNPGDKDMFSFGPGFGLTEMNKRGSSAGYGVLAGEDSDAEMESSNNMENVEDLLMEKMNKDLKSVDLEEPFCWQAYNYAKVHMLHNY
ncbi:hypothetical protein ACET3Z_005285 [Daucus carota]